MKKMGLVLAASAAVSLAVVLATPSFAAEPAKQESPATQVATGVINVAAEVVRAPLASAMMITGSSKQKACDTTKSMLVCGK